MALHSEKQSFRSFNHWRRAKKTENKDKIIYDTRDYNYVKKGFQEYRKEFEKWLKDFEDTITFIEYILPRRTESNHEDIRLKYNNLLRGYKNLTHYKDLLDYKNDEYRKNDERYTTTQNKILELYDLFINETKDRLNETKSAIFEFNTFNFFQNIADDIHPQMNIF